MGTVRSRTATLIVGLLFGLSTAFATAGTAGAVDTGGKTTTVKTTAKPGPRGAASGFSVIDGYAKKQGKTFINNQTALESYKGWITSRPGLGASGYIESVDDVAHKATQLLWSGPATPLQRTILAEGVRRGIAVTVQHRTYSLKQLKAAVAATVQSAAHGGWSGFHITDIAAVTADFDGITVNGHYTSASATNRAPQVRALKTTTLGVKVQVKPGKHAVPAFGSRDTDYPAFNAGGYMLSPSTGSTCSTGFAISIYGTSHITTARHCDHNDYQDRDASNTYGTGVLNTGDGGARVLSAHGSSLAFDGPWDSIRYYKIVTGYGNVSMYDSVCTGGGNSGEHCYVKVDAMMDWWNDGYGGFWTIHATQQIAGDIAAIQGDSGGPVITPNGTGVNATGMIQAGDDPVSNCGPVHDGGGNVCGKGVYFSSMVTIVNSISGGALVTG